MEVILALLLNLIATVPVCYSQSKLIIALCAWSYNSIATPCLWVEYNAGYI